MAFKYELEDGSRWSPEAGGNDNLFLTNSVILEVV